MIWMNGNLSASHVSLYFIFTKLTHHSTSTIHHILTRLITTHLKLHLIYSHTNHLYCKTETLTKLAKVSLILCSRVRCCTIVKS